MSSDTKVNYRTQTPAPPQGSKKTLMILLLLLVIGALGTGAFLFLRSDSADALILPEAFTTMLKNNTPGRRKISLTFQGARIDPNGAVAMLNNEMVAVGERFEGVQVLKVGKRTLTVEYQGKTYDIALGDSVSLPSD